MDVMLVVDGPSALDEVASLRVWLTDEDNLRGRVEQVEAAPVPGTLTGAVVSGLTIAAASASVATTLASVLITWLKSRVGQVGLRVTRPDGVVVDLQADQVRGLTAEQTWQHVDAVAARIAEAISAPAPGSDPPAGLAPTPEPDHAGDEIDHSG
jgi:hypothetical protein